MCGGVIVVFEIVNRLIQRGVNASVIIADEKKEIDGSSFLPIFYSRGDFYSRELPESSLYVATYFETVPLAFRAHSLLPDSSLCYLIQGYEGWFPLCDMGAVLDTYCAIDNKVVVSSWLEGMLQSMPIVRLLFPMVLILSSFILWRTSVTLERLICLSL